MAELTSRKLFIGGLSYQTTSETLSTHFTPYGALTDVIVMKDPITRRSRGFGFVTFLEEASVDRVLLDGGGGHIVDEREVDVKRAVPRAESSAVGGGGGGGGGSFPNMMNNNPNNNNNNSSNGIYNNPSNSNNGNGSYGMWGNTPVDSNGLGLFRSNFNPQKSPAPSPPLQPTSFYSSSSHQPKNKLFIGGLHYATDDRTFRTYFESFGSVLSASIVFSRETRKSRGFGFVVFNDESSIDRVNEIDEHFISGKEVEIKGAVPRSFQPINLGNSNGNGGLYDGMAFDGMMMQMGYSGNGNGNDEMGLNMNNMNMNNMNSDMSNLRVGEDKFGPGSGYKGKNPTNNYIYGGGYGGAGFGPGGRGGPGGGGGRGSGEKPKMGQQPGGAGRGYGGGVPFRGVSQGANNSGVGSNNSLPLLQQAMLAMSQMNPNMINQDPAIMDPQQQLLLQQTYLMQQQMAVQQQLVSNQQAQQQHAAAQHAEQQRSKLASSQSALTEEDITNDEESHQKMTETLQQKHYQQQEDLQRFQQQQLEGYVFNVSQQVGGGVFEGMIGGGYGNVNGNVNEGGGGGSGDGENNDREAVGAGGEPQSNGDSLLGGFNNPSNPNSLGGNNAYDLGLSMGGFPPWNMQAANAGNGMNGMTAHNVMQAQQIISNANNNCNSDGNTNGTSSNYAEGISISTDESTDASEGSTSGENKGGGEGEKREREREEVESNGEAVK